MAAVRGEIYLVDSGRLPSPWFLPDQVDFRASDAQCGIECLDQIALAENPPYQTTQDLKRVSKSIGRGPSLRNVRLYLLDFVKLSGTFRPRLCRLSFVFVGLAICVFSWGLQYKLSLYYPKHSTHHQLPEAKLLSKDEQPAATKGLVMTSAKPVQDIVRGGLFTLTLFVWILGLLPISGATPTGPERTRSWLQSLSASLTAFFFRPPPSFVFVSNS